MDTIDITDTAFSLGNISNVTNIISNATDVITETVSNANEVISESISNISDTISDTILENNDNSLLFYFVIGLVIITIIIVVYNYYKGSSKRVTFQEKLNKCYGNNVCEVDNNYNEKNSSYYEGENMNNYNEDNTYNQNIYRPRDI